MDLISAPRRKERPDLIDEPSVFRGIFNPMGLLLICFDLWLNIFPGTPVPAGDELAA